MSGTYFEYKCVNWHSASWTEFPWSNEYIEEHGGKVPEPVEKGEDQESTGNDEDVENDEEGEEGEEDEEEEEEDPEDQWAPFVDEDADTN